MNSWPHKYEIEHVRQPEERIALYATGKKEGKFDIALIRLTEDVTFIPHQVSPVCIGKVQKEESIEAYVSGFGTFGSTGVSGIKCFTDGKGPRRFEE